MAGQMKTITVGVAAIIVLSLVSSIACYYIQQFPSSDVGHDILEAEKGGAVAGRIVSVPTKMYMQSFRATLKLGECPLVLEVGRIKTCSDVFEGEEILLPKSSTIVYVTRVESVEDIITHVVGGVGVSVGVLGLISVSPKVTVAVGTEQNRKTLNLLSSYEMNRGVITLHNPRPKVIKSDRPLFLSEIELGGNELLLVTLEFESEKKKVEVEVSVTIKILFISITAKLNYVRNTFNAKASCRIQFKSSWRPEIDTFYSKLEHCIPKVEEIETMYKNGPNELRKLNIDDERLHYMYYFSSWNVSPYGSKFNLALINHDLDFLTEQNTEIKAVIERINKLKDQRLPDNMMKHMTQLNQTLSEKSEKLTTGMAHYHNLSPEERKDLRDIYGVDKAPQYYERELKKIVA